MNLAQLRDRPGLARTLAAILDRSSASFQVPPKQREVQKDRLTARLGVIGFLTIGLALPLAVIARGLDLKVYDFFPLVLEVPLVWLFWSTVRPPVLSATSVEVSYEAPFTRKRILRSELAVVFRGHFSIGTRPPRITWLSCYAFMRTNGRVGLLVPTRWFTDEDIVTFAKQLNVPMRGDFSQSVRSSADPLNL